MFNSVTESQVRLPAITKASNWEAGDDVKESGLSADTGRPVWKLGDSHLKVQRSSPGKMGNSCLKVHFHLSLEAEVFIRRERGIEQIGQKDQGRGMKILYMQTSTVHSNKASDGPMCLTPAACHPGSTVEG